MAGALTSIGIADAGWCRRRAPARTRPVRLPPGASALSAAACLLGGGRLAQLGGFEFLDGDGLLGIELLEPPQFAGGEGCGGAGLFEVGGSGVALGLGQRAGAGIQQGRRQRINDGQHGLAGLDLGAGLEGDAPKLAGDRRGDDVALFDAGLAFLVDGGAQRADGGARGFDRHRLRPEAGDDQRDQHDGAGVGQPAAGVAVGGVALDVRSWCMSVAVGHDVNRLQ